MVPGVVGSSPITHPIKTGDIFGYLLFLYVCWLKWGSNNSMQCGRALPARAGPSRSLIFAFGKNANESHHPHLIFHACSQNAFDPDLTQTGKLSEKSCHCEGRRPVAIPRTFRKLSRIPTPVCALARNDSSFVFLWFHSASFSKPPIFAAACSCALLVAWV